MGERLQTCTLQRPCSSIPHHIPHLGSVHRLHERPVLANHEHEDLQHVGVRGGIHWAACVEQLQQRQQQHLHVGAREDVVAEGPTLRGGRGAVREREGGGGGGVFMGVPRNSWECLGIHGSTSGFKRVPHELCIFPAPASGLEGSTALEGGAVRCEAQPHLVHEAVQQEGCKLWIVGEAPGRQGLVDLFVWHPRRLP